MGGARAAAECTCSVPCVRGREDSVGGDTGHSWTALERCNPGGHLLRAEASEEKEAGALDWTARDD